MLYESFRTSLEDAAAGIRGADDFVSMERRRKPREVLNPSEYIPKKLYPVIPWSLRGGKLLSISTSDLCRRREGKLTVEVPRPEPRKRKIGPALRRRLREEQAEGQYTAEEWFDLQVKYSNCCLRCGTTEKRIVADHIQPLFRGGSNGIENIQPLCWGCNLWKGLKTIDFRPDIS